MSMIPEGDPVNRLDPGVFDLDITGLRRGYRSATYFGRAKRILEAEKPNLEVTMQVFQKGNSVLCGIDQAIAILKVATGHWSNQRLAELLFDKTMDLRIGARHDKVHDPMMFRQHQREIDTVTAELADLWVSEWDRLHVEALHDGEEITPWEPVMQITGPLSTFVHLESAYLGVLARQTKVATNVRRVCQAADGKPVLFFADRFDYYATQGLDGYAAHVGGAKGVATDSMAAWMGERGLGTMPHALIAAFDGDVVKAAHAFHEHIPEVPLVALVDFTNDCVGEAVRCLKEFGGKLHAVRLDTSETLVDPSVLASGRMGDFKPTGVNPVLVNEVRAALDAAGGEHVQIMVSGGFDAEKITMFEAIGVPVDSYAVGSSLLRGAADYTADVVKPVAKTGRWYRPNPKLEKVT